jgi:hypothetical protein
MLRDMHVLIKEKTRMDKTYTFGIENPDGQLKFQEDMQKLKKEFEAVDIRCDVATCRPLCVPVHSGCVFCSRVDCSVSQCLWEGGPMRRPVQKKTIITTNNVALVLKYGTKDKAYPHRYPNAPEPTHLCTPNGPRRCHFVNRHHETHQGGVPPEVCPYPAGLAFDIAMTINEAWRRQYGMGARCRETNSHSWLHVRGRSPSRLI